MLRGSLQVHLDVLERLRAVCKKKREEFLQRTNLHEGAPIWASLLDTKVIKLSPHFLLNPVPGISNCTELCSGH